MFYDSTVKLALTTVKSKSFYRRYLSWVVILLVMNILKIDTSWVPIMSQAWNNDNPGMMSRRCGFLDQRHHQFSEQKVAKMIGTHLHFQPIFSLPLRSLHDSSIVDQVVNFVLTFQEILGTLSDRFEGGQIQLLNLVIKYRQTSVHEINYDITVKVFLMTELSK